VESIPLPASRLLDGDDRQDRVDPPLTDVRLQLLGLEPKPEQGLEPKPEQAGDLVGVAATHVVGSWSRTNSVASLSRFRRVVTSLPETDVSLLGIVSSRSGQPGTSISAMAASVAAWQSTQSSKNSLEPPIASVRPARFSTAGGNHHVG